MITIPNPYFTGQVDVKLYFGTPFDNINIPYRTNLIEESALRIVELKGQVIWQSTWISELRVNVNNYDDILGCQFVSVIDAASTFYDHWYMCLGYKQLSKKTASLLLKYDPLLSIGVNNITGITGTLKRWSVMSDTPFAYTNSPEPISRISDLKYSYTRIPCALKTEDYKDDALTIAGFPYDMTHAATVTSVFPVSESQDPLDYSVPVFTNAEPTRFSYLDSPAIPEYPDPVEMEFNDGLRYYQWDDPSLTVYTNYSSAIAWGYTMSPVAYTLPPSALYTYSTPSGSVYKDIKKIVGFTSHVNTALPLYESGYKNRKTGEVGLFYTLYNEFTGDSVTVANEELLDTYVDVSCNPYVNGGFYARFHSYVDDKYGHSGIVRSCGWQPVTISANTGAGVTLNDFNLKTAQNTLTLTTSQSAKSMGLQKSQTLENATAQYWTGALSTTAGVAASVVGGGDPALAGAGAIGGATSGVVGSYLNAKHANEAYAMNVQQLYQSESNQLNILNAQGDINSQVPPAVKYAQASIYSGASYDFVIRKTTLSSYDRSRLDVFLTQYGYNVDGMWLADPTYLHSRKRFTFIQADNVRVYGAINAFNARIDDFQTQLEIEHRFAVGLRIWDVIPDFDYLQNNEPYDDHTEGDDPDVPQPPDVDPPVDPEPQPDPQTPAERIIEVARLEIGTAENPPDSNNVKYNTDYYGRNVSGSAYAWCCVFVWWVFREAGLSHMFYGGQKCAGCTKLMEYYQNKGKEVSWEDAQPGDLVFFTWENNPDKANHVGILISKDSNSTVTTLEGNTGTGGKVMTRSRNRSTIITFAHPY